MADAPKDSRPPFSLNGELSRLFGRIADLMEIDGGDRFRINTYRRVSRVLKDLQQDVADLAAGNQLGKIPGIGKSTTARVEQYLQTGHIDVLDQLEAKLPDGLPDLLRIPGLGPKKIALAHARLGVGNLDDVKRAIESGALADLPGMGTTSVRRIAEGIEFLERSGDRTLLGVAMPAAESIAEVVASFPAVQRVEIAGSLRRGKETIGDIDILCNAEEGPSIVDQFVKLDGVHRVLAAGRTKGSVTIDVGEAGELQIDLRVVPAESFGAALQYFTGSKEHNVRLRERAIQAGWRLNEYGLYEGERRVAGADEEGIYGKLGLPLIPPELREDRGELGLVEVPELVEPGDVRGDLHMHTTASDGRCSIDDMALAAKEMGYEYIAICDHSKSSTVAGGLSVDRMWQHVEAIRAADQRLRGISILVGTECDILPDGSLDYPDELLAECDWVVASIHSAMTTATGKRKRSATERTLAAIENRFVCAIGHPTGRLLNRRAPMELDIAAVAEAAARTGTALEINASYKRLDLKDTHVRQALETGASLVINTDSHHVDQLAGIRYGIITARRGGASANDVWNCLPLSSLKKCIAAKRKGGKSHQATRQRSREP